MTNPYYLDESGERTRAFLNSPHDCMIRESRSVDPVQVMGFGMCITGVKTEASF